MKLSAMCLRFLQVAFLAVLLWSVPGPARALVWFERHTGLFAPVWSADGNAVFALRRSTEGLIWGLGWEFFTPPARTRVTADRYELLRIDAATASVEVLTAWSGSPLVDRTTRHYRGRIFNPLSAWIQPTETGLRLRVRLSIPRVPRSEVWGIDAVWEPGQPFRPQWTEDHTGGFSRPEEVLRDGREVMTVRGPESFDAAILIVEPDGRYKTLLTTDGFARQYPDGVPARTIADRSNRAQIERVRSFRSRHAELVAGFTAQGLSEGDAILKAYDVMEEEGFLPRSLRITATLLDSPLPGLETFEIPQDYLDVGLFQDLAAAIATPGEEVKTSLGTYLKYYDDDLGPRLRDFREDGGDRFLVAVGDRLFLIEER